MEREAAEAQAKREAEEAERAQREAEAAERRRQEEEEHRWGLWWGGCLMGWQHFSGDLTVMQTNPNGVPEAALLLAKLLWPAAPAAAGDRLERTISSKAASLPPEPADGEEGVVSLMVRLPSGSRIGRRFLRTDRLQVGGLQAGARVGKAQVLETLLL